MANPTGEAVLATTWLLIGIAAAMITARLYMRLKIKRLSFQWSDIFLCLSWAMSVTTASFDIIFFSKGALKEHISFTLVGYDGTPADIEYLSKLNWFQNFPFYATFYLTKFAFLAFYLDLFPVFLNRIRFTVWLTLVYCVCALVVTFAVNLFICWPPWHNWELDPAVACAPYLPRIVFNICFALHLAGEIIIFALPFFMLHRIQLKLDVKIGVYCTFALGLVAIAFALTRFFSVQLGSTIPGQTRRFRSLTLIQLYSALDINISLIVACMPSLRPYLRMFTSSSLVSRIMSRPKDQSNGNSKTLNSVPDWPSSANNTTATAAAAPSAAAVSADDRGGPHSTNSGPQKKASSTASEEIWDESASGNSMRRGQGSDIELVRV